jgi:REP element-mobilizing transposase RayT
MDSRPNRRLIRLRGYDYSRAGAYFVSICTKERNCLFGDIENQAMTLNAAGRMLDKWYVELENKFKDIRCDEYIIMPNHFHAIIQNIGPVGADLCVCPDDLKNWLLCGCDILSARNYNWPILSKQPL